VAALGLLFPHAHQADARENHAHLRVIRRDPNVAQKRHSASDAQRETEVKSLEAALTAYRKDHRVYPQAGSGPNADNSVALLKDALVGGNYIKNIPNGGDYRYVWTAGGAGYGIYVRLAASPAGCMAGDGATGRGFYASAPACPF